MVTMFHGGGANEQRRKSSEGYDEHIERHIEGGRRWCETTDEVVVCVSAVKVKHV